MLERYRGAIERFENGQLTGWIFDRERTTQPVELCVRVDETHEMVVRADQPRGDLAAAGVGNGRCGFTIELAPFLGKRTTDLIVACRTKDGTEVYGSPVRLGIPPEITVDRVEAGVLVGWAHGPWHAKVAVEVWSAEEFLFAWPAHMPRRDLREAEIGDGSHGFSIPLGSLLDGSKRSALTLRLSAWQVSVPIPEGAIGKCERALSDAIAHRFASTDQLVHGLLREAARAAGLQRPRAGDIALAFGTLQRLLDRIAALREEIETAREFDGPRATAANATGDRAVPDSGAASTRPNLDLAGITQAQVVGAEALVHAIKDRLLAPYAEQPAERRAIEAELVAINNVGLLRAVSKAARGQDFLRLAAVSYEAALRANDRPSIAGLRHLRRQRAWLKGLDDQRLHLPAQIVRSRGGVRRTLYVLWRGVPYDTNGYATRSHYLLRSFIEAGADVVACTRLGYPWDAEKGLSASGSMESIDGVTYLHLGGEQANRHSLPLDVYIDECATRIAHAALVTRADIIHSASNWVAALPALKAARLTGLPFCYEMRGLWEVTRSSTNAGYERSDHYALFRKMETEVARSSDLVFAITRGLKAEMERRGYDGPPMLIAPNGVDVSRFEPQQRDHELLARFGIGDEVVFGFIGSFVPYEGLILLCEAAARLKQRGKTCRLLLIGDGASFNDVKEAVRRLGIEDMAILPGRVPFSDVPRYYSIVDVAIFPRLATEITEMVSPLKPFEAMAMGKPVIGSSVDAIAEIVQHNTTGWLFRKDDIEDLTNALEAAVDGREKLSAFGLAARRFVEQHHNWPKIARGIMAKWDELRERGRLS